MTADWRNCNIFKGLVQQLKKNAGFGEYYVWHIDRTGGFSKFLKESLN